MINQSLLKINSNSYMCFKQNVQTIHSWLGGGAVTTIDTELPEHVIKWASSVLRGAINENLKGPKAHFDYYGE